MSNQFGRENLWTPEIWTDIDKTVQSEVGRQRVAQKVFPAQQLPNAANVPADVFINNNAAIQEGATLPFIEIGAYFALTKSQVDNETNLHAGRILARTAARSIALAEDMLFFQGNQVNQVNRANQTILGLLQPPVVAVNVGNLVGLLNLQITAINVPPAAPNVWGMNTVNAVNQGIAALIQAGQPGPFALLLSWQPFADVHVPLALGNRSAADMINPLLENRLYCAPAFPINPAVAGNQRNDGLLVSLGGDPTTIYISQDIITAFTQVNQQGNYMFRVFERIQLVSRELASLVHLVFQ